MASSIFGVRRIKSFQGGVINDVLGIIVECFRVLSWLRHHTFLLHICFSLNTSHSCYFGLSGNLPESQNGPSPKLNPFSIAKRGLCHRRDPEKSANPEFRLIIYPKDRAVFGFEATVQQNRGGISKREF